MMTEWLKLERLEGNDLPLPEYKTEMSAGVDFAACLTRTCKLVAHSSPTAGDVAGAQTNGCEKRKFRVSFSETSGHTRIYQDVTTEEPKGDPSELALFIRPNETLMIPLGWKAEFGPGFVLNIHVRSSMGLCGLNLANSTGIVDPDYRGELFACVYNRTPYDLLIKHGQRIAQGVLLAFNQALIEEVESVDDTQRGEGGFGSTGVE